MIAVPTRWPCSVRASRKRATDSPRRAGPLPTTMLAMPLVRIRADVIARAREAMRDDGFAGEIRVEGEGEVHGVSARWTRVCHADGSSRETVVSELGYEVGYRASDATGWRIDASGMPSVLELGDLEDTIATTAVWSGRWLAHASVEVGDLIAATSGEYVLALRVGARSFQLALDGVSYLPRRLVPEGRTDASLELTDYRPGGFGMLPHTAVWREAWLADTLHISAVERTTTRWSYTSTATPPDDVTWNHAPITWRKTRGGLYAARALVDGHDLGWLALDTGASMLAIDEQVVAPLGLREHGRRIVRTSDACAGAPYRWASELAVGPIVLARPRFLEIDLASFSAGSGIKLAGVIGNDLFARAVVTFDRSHGVSITKVHSDDDRDAIPLRFEEGVPVIPVRFPGGDGLVVVDTGSTAGLTVYAGAAHGVDLRNSKRVGLRGASGSVGAMAGTLPWLELGSHRLDAVSAIVARPGEGAVGAATRGHVIGNIGMAILGAFTLEVDYPLRRLLLRR